MQKLSGKTALVTGSTDGLGRLVARKLGQAGARVLVHGRDAERGARVIAEHHRQLPAFGVDLCRCTRGGRRDHGGRNRRAEAGNRLEQLAPVADRGHPDADQVFGG
jgi:NAD(P)-dependent dehydrogenase (short-subunit alcohol dehydrogenase family)